MSRPRSGTAPSAYLDAWQVLPPDVVRAVLDLPVRRGPNKRLFTFSLERNTVACAVLGEDLYTSITNHLARAHPHAVSWRIYFAADKVSAKGRKTSYAKAEELMAKGYSRTAVAAVLGINDTTLRRNLTGKYVATEQRTQYSPDDVLKGYTYLVSIGLPEVGAVSNICGQVAELLRGGHGPKT